MTLAIADAESILRSRLGEPAKPPTDYVVGFRTPSGKVLAIHREAKETRVWFQPPAPPTLVGVRLLDEPKNGNSNINGELLALRAPTTLRVEVDSREALSRFIDWYAALKPSVHVTSSNSGVDPVAFKKAFARFQDLVRAKSGYPFVNFHEGMAAVWERYKPLLREHALGLLRSDTWFESDIGTGKILNCMIEAIEIQEGGDLINNLVFWRNEFGHANRDHRVFLEAASNQKLRRELESLLFGLFCRGADEATTFDNLSELTGRKYPLAAYVFFLKDMDRFMPIQPTGFDRAFRALGIELTTLRNCSWSNYSSYNEVLGALRAPIADAIGLKGVRLVDAHSFCWILSTLIKLETKGELAGKHSGGAGEGRIIGGREKSMLAMRYSTQNTAKNSNGQIVQKILKNKELRMSGPELQAQIEALMTLQGDQCALTGIPFQFHGPETDKNLLPSLDRIDSDGHYETGNLQVVCQFINFWKGDSDNEEFRRLLMLVRGVEAAD